MTDDWSYFITARILAQTGHIVYNGWATAMIGWQLYWGALFIRLFGASMTSLRASTLLVSMATAYFAHRTMVRVGIGDRNAAVGTLALALSPLFLPLALSYMTDISGLFVIVFCVYACLRALQTQSNRSVLTWLAVAALTNAVGGTARQIAWLGVLVMVPSTVWLLRKRPNVLFLGIALYALSLLIVFGSLHWLSLQPWSIPEPLVPGRVGIAQLFISLRMYARCLASLGIFLLPFLAAFVLPLAKRNRRMFVLLVAAGLLAGGACGLVWNHMHKLSVIIFPFLRYTVMERGLVNWALLRTDRPEVLSVGVRVAISACMLLAVLCFAGFLFLIRQRNEATPDARPAAVPEAVSRAIPNSPPMTPWHTLLVLLGPFTLAYFALLWPRAAFAFNEVEDRYLLPLVFLGILLIVRLYQDSVRPNLPLVTYAIALLFAAFAVAGTHDVFSMYRARSAAVDELVAAGVPANSIEAGMEYDGTIQVERYGHINEPRIRVPANAFVHYPSPFPDYCEPYGRELTPALIPGYVLTYDPGVCGGPSTFAPVTYHAWLAPHTVTIYIAKTFKDQAAKH
jgi:hypothetical protein